MHISAEQLAPILDLYERGLYLQAYRVAEQLAPLAEWQGTDAKVLAGRLAYTLGSSKLAHRHHLSAWRNDRTHAEAQYFYARVMLDRHGPLRAWYFLKQHSELSAATPALLADWYGLRALVVGSLRDFEEAEQWLAKAEAADPNEAYIWVEKSSLLELQDRYEEALQAAQHALELRPWYRPAVQATAQLYVLLDREQDALMLLSEAAAQLESAAIVAQLAQLQSDLELHKAARTNWERFIEFSPLLEEDDFKWLNGRRSDAAYMCGDFAEAQTLAEKTDSHFFKQVAKHLKKTDGAAPRRVLPVNFIRQHHLTCAPATLTMISRFWQRAAEHLSVAEQICYGGTTDYSERKWAADNGYVTREFCVNLDDSVKLIERGVPFTLATVDPGNAHLQAVIGYDKRRGTLLLRDPYVSSLGEALGEGLLKHYRSSGPRGMALVPREQAALLDGLDLREAGLYDELYAIQDALEKHQRTAAETVWQRLKEAYPEHRLTHWARLVMAWYDEDHTQILACVEKLLELFPEDANLKMSKIYSLRVLTRRSERLAYLEELCQWPVKDEKTAAGDEAKQPGTDDAEQAASDTDSDDEEEDEARRKKDPSRFFDPLFWQQYAEELSDDARTQKRALRFLQRVLRYRPTDPHSIYLVANIYWSQRRFAEACELYRIAACLKDTSEQYVHGYFIAARQQRQTPAALKLLEDRVQRFGKRSGLPARTLSNAYEQVDDEARALQVLATGLQMRPDDGDLLLYAADAHSRYGNFAQANALLAQAKEKASRSSWLRGAAMIAVYQGQLPQALQLWREVLAGEPLAPDANRHTARLLAETAGEAAAIEFLRDVTQRFPHSVPLHQMLVEWLREQPEEAIKVLRHVVEIDPMDAWAQRELAFRLAQLQHYDEATQMAEQAFQLEPENPYSYCTRGSVHAAAGRVEAAKADFRHSLKLSVDTDYALTELAALSHTPAERRATFELIQQELINQVTSGDGLLAYRQQAKDTLDAEEVLRFLQTALEARPDLALAWSAVIEQLVDLQRLDEALQLAEQATQRFPLVPRLWLELAQVQRVRLNTPGEIEALQQALRINPSWGAAAQQLAEAFERAGDRQKGKDLLERACALTPLDHFNHGCLADLLWHLGEKEEALKRIQRAITLEPGYDWGWRVLRDWAQELKKPELAVECARHLTTQRPGSPQAWLTLANTITDPRALNERLAAIDEALRLQPHSVEAYRLRVRVLTEAKRFDEARAACRPAVFGDQPPADLRIMAANVEAERGEVIEAVKILRALVKDEPNYFPAWYQLADWFRTTDEHGAYLEAAEAMAKLMPHYPLALGYLSEARIRTQDRDGAKQSLQRALQLDPNYEYAGTTLFDLQLEDREFDAAEATVQRLRQYLGGDETKLRELKLALARDDYDTARQRFRELCLSESDSRSELDQAVAANEDDRWQKIVDEVLETFLDTAQANTNAAILWIERCASRKQWERCQGWLEALAAAGPELEERWRKASIAWLGTLAEGRQKHRLRSYVETYRAALHADDKAWAQVGYNFYEIGDVRTALDWMRDWQKRTKLEPWMLWNLALALRQNKHERESRAVSQHALTLPPDHMTDPHLLLLAVDDLLRNEYESGQQRLAHINVGALREWDRFLYDLATALLDADHQRNTLQVSHRSIIERLFDLRREAKFVETSPVLRELHRRTVWHVARQSGSWWLQLTAGLRLALLAGWYGVFGD